MFSHKLEIKWKKSIEILKIVLELETVDTTCSQQTCEKWDSISQLNLVVEFESEFDISLEPEEIGEMTSYEDVVRIVKSKIEG